MEDWGKVDLKLDEFLKAHNISRSSLSRNAQIHFLFYYHNLYNLQHS